VTDAPESVISRVRKLLALARDKGTTREEAAVAAARARELMLKHRLTEDDVVEVQSFVEEMELSGDGMMAIWRVGLLASVATYFDCTVVRKRSLRGAEHVKVIGKPKNVDATHTLYTRLVKEIDKLCSQDLKDESRSDGESRSDELRSGSRSGSGDRPAKVTRSMRDAYHRGAAVTIRDRLREMRESGEVPVTWGFSAETIHQPGESRGSMGRGEEVGVALGRFQGTDDHVAEHMKSKYGGVPKAEPPSRTPREQKLNQEEAANEAWAYMLGRAAGESISLLGKEGRRGESRRPGFHSRSGFGFSPRARRSSL
jgi:hypothetical protein